MSDSEEEASSGMEEDVTASNVTKSSEESQLTQSKSSSSNSDSQNDEPDDREEEEPHPNSFVKLTNLRKDFGATPSEQHEPLVELTRPHRESFDWLIEEGLFLISRDLPPVEFALKNGCRVSLNFEELEVTKPLVAKDEKLINKKRKSFVTEKSPELYPSECRERGITYKGTIHASLVWRVNEKIKGLTRREIGEIPIMLKSKSCNLNELKPKQLIEKGEEAHEMGGYFVINGIEKVVRMLIMNRRNYPLALERGRWKSRGPLYTEKGIMIRSVKADQSSLTNTLHYLSNGNVTIGFTHRKEQFLVPIIMILKSLVNQTDLYIFKRLMQGEDDNSFLKTSVVEMIRSSLKAEDSLGDQQQNLSYMGKLFRIRLMELPPWWSDEQVGEYLVNSCILPHLGGRCMDKFNLLVHMTRKLFRFVDGKCCAENPDSPMNQEILLPGHLIGMLLKEKLASWLTGLRMNIVKADQTDETVGETMVNTSGEAVILAAGRKVTPLTKAFEYLLATGNVSSQTGLGLMQASGFSVVAEKINFYRFLAHFRCVHRGAYFTEMRTTAVRKLLPEAWGFLCPVHTPDGTPCGLLNHLAASCEIVNHNSSVGNLRKFLKQNGLVPCEELTGASETTYPVMLDGRFVGGIPRDGAVELTNELRRLKTTSDSRVPKMLEIGFVPATEVASQDPGIFLSTHPARMMRPVKNLSTDSVEWIGSFEQVYLNVAVDASEITPGQTTHVEISKTNILSVIANLTPFSDFNQSPRNMYQCQMGKQTMATPTYSYPKRADNKLYRLMTPQTPMVRPKLYDHYQMDNYPMGTNAVVAVVSYTGYDMEDAMIINKGSYERGFCWGYIYKSEIVDLRQVTGETLWVTKFPYAFGNPSVADSKNESSSKSTSTSTLEPDGLPAVGTELKYGDAYYSYVNFNNPDTPIVKKYMKSEPGFVEQVKALQSENSMDGFVRVCITLRIVRHPIIGDKFASRHGQKGVCSLRFSYEDMPFCESGLVPDIIFNPHGYPSRMTIGMMLESMAGKSVSMNGRPEDASPFSSAFDESRPAHEYHGNLLRQAGFDYYGTETMYSGINGEMMKAEIFIGVVYYQRLRHMVSDKYQVRTTGPIDSVTRQPVKGRKMGGGIRFGEMERDALLSHGCSFLLQERLMNVSDRSVARICLDCKQLFTTTVIPPRKSWGEAKVVCRVCDKSSAIRSIVVPFCFQYLVAELAAVNIKTEISCKATI